MISDEEFKEWLLKHVMVMKDCPKKKLRSSRKIIVQLQFGTENTIRKSNPTRREVEVAVYKMKKEKKNIIAIALKCDNIRLAKITSKLRFDNEKCKFYHEAIPKAIKIKRMPT